MLQKSSKAHEISKKKQQLKNRTNVLTKKTQTPSPKMSQKLQLNKLVTVNKFKINQITSQKSCQVA